MAVVAGVLGKAGQKGQRRRLQDASQGNVPWNMTPELTRYIEKDVQAAVTKRKEVMGKMQSNIQGFTEEEQMLLKSTDRGVARKVTEDDIVNMMGETISQDDEASNATVKPEELPPTFDTQESCSSDKRPEEIDESTLLQASQQTTKVA